MALEYKTARRGGSLDDLLKAKGEEDLNQRQQDEATARVLDSQNDLGQKVLLQDQINPIRKIQAERALQAMQPDSAQPQAPAAPPPDSIPQGSPPPWTNTIASNTVPAGMPTASIPPTVAPQKDAYSYLEEQIKQREALMAQKKKNIDVTSFDPSNPLEYTARKQTALDVLQGEQQKLDETKFDLSNKRAFLAIKPQLDAIQTKYKKSIEKGDYNEMLREMQATIPANLIPTAKEYMAQADRQKPNQQFNPDYAVSRREGGLRSTSNKESETYNKARDFQRQAEQTYDEYVKDPHGPGSRSLQSAILDKFVGVSIQKSPTEAQIALAKEWPGAKDAIDWATGKIRDNAIITPENTAAMMRAINLETTGLGSNLKGKNTIRSNAAELGGVDPGLILNYPNENITADSTRMANAPWMQAQGKSDSLLTPQQKNLRTKYKY